MRNLTCFEAWQAIKQPVAPKVCCWYVFFYQRFPLSFLGMNCVYRIWLLYWFQQSIFRSKDWNVLTKASFEVTTHLNTKAYQLFSLYKCARSVSSFFRNISRSETVRLLLRRIIWSLELQIFLTSKILVINFFCCASTNQARCCKLQYNRRYSFVSTGNLTSADKLTFCRPVRNAAPSAGERSFKNSKGMNAGGFSLCLLPTPLPQSFSGSTSVQLLRGRISYFTNHKRKKRPPATKANHGEVLDDQQDSTRLLKSG